ncbi:hypothetical protein EJ04DRAFT_526524 [Polyplosphaeria fusca]|uniref:Uncharacterized protein n=1 Tax=Polyplosphaeria fusca TaxID=682080 RepID=A0A9P4QTV2_9PLEO|nr:hypothetical protein EJ04DRAFT_526524 [Polyplosphaeria fusca]
MAPKNQVHTPLIIVLVLATLFIFILVSYLNSNLPLRTYLRQTRNPAVWLFTWPYHTYHLLRRCLSRRSKTQQDDIELAAPRPGPGPGPGPEDGAQSNAPTPAADVPNPIIPTPLDGHRRKISPISPPPPPPSPPPPPPTLSRAFAPTKLAFVHTALYWKYTPSRSPLSRACSPLSTESLASVPPHPRTKMLDSSVSLATSGVCGPVSAGALTPPLGRAAFYLEESLGSGTGVGSAGKEGAMALSERLRYESPFVVGEGEEEVSVFVVGDGDLEGEVQDGGEESDEEWDEWVLAEERKEAFRQLTGMYDEEILSGRPGPSLDERLG